jgi:hypothetical protein
VRGVKQLSNVTLINEWALSRRGDTMDKGSVLQRQIASWLVVDPTPSNVRQEHLASHAQETPPQELIMKLPGLEMPTSGGEILYWVRIRQVFEENVNSKVMNCSSNSAVCTLW